MDVVYTVLTHIEKVSLHAYMRMHWFWRHAASEMGKPKVREHRRWSGISLLVLREQYEQADEAEPSSQITLHGDVLVLT